MSIFGSGHEQQHSKNMRVCSCGALMALRAGALRQVTGIVITASHNPEQDNGVKLVDPNGNMLDSQWEASLHLGFSLHSCHFFICKLDGHPVQSKRSHALNASCRKQTRFASSAQQVLKDHTEQMFCVSLLCFLARR